MKVNFDYQKIKPEGTFRAFVKTQKECLTPLHSHPAYELNLVMESNGIRQVGNNLGSFEEGDLILLAPNIPHCWKSNAQIGTSYSSLVIQWDEEFLDGIWRNIPEFDHIHQLLNRSSKGIKFDKHIGYEIRHRQSEFHRYSPFEQLITFLQLLNDLSCADEFEVLCDEEPPIPNRLVSSRIEVVCRYIKEHFTEKITLEQVSSLVNMSQGAFSRFFSKTTAKPFFSFLNEYRINIACGLLANTDMQAREICYACGYDCLQFFYRQFAKYKDCSPQAYRKQFYSLEKSLILQD